MTKIENPLKSKILKKIKNKSALLGVIGLGYVGLPLAVEKAKAGYRIIGFDIQEKKVKQVNNGENYISDILDADLKEVVKQGLLQATTEYSFLKDMDTVCICVPTPLDVHQQPDLSFISSTVQSIAPYLHSGMLIVLESTTYPGTTEELIKPVLEEYSGLKCGQEFFLAFSPERIDPGNPWYKVRNTPKVIGGVTADCSEVAACLYRNIIQNEIHIVSSPKVAEMEKIYENVFRYTNIALANEMAILCHKMEIDFWEVIEAAKTKPYGFMPFYPGPGVGGHCIPVDPFYLSWKAREFNHHTKLIELAGEINQYMPEYVVERISDILSKKCNKPLNNAKILILGVAYKRDVNDIRKSPALEIIKQLENKGANVIYYDPYVADFAFMNKKYYSLDSLTPEIIDRQDITVIITDHSNLDYKMIQKRAKLIFDTRNIIKQKSSNVEKL